MTFVLKSHLSKSFSFELQFNTFFWQTTPYTAQVMPYLYLGVPGMRGKRVYLVVGLGGVGVKCKVVHSDEFNIFIDILRE